MYSFFAKTNPSGRTITSAAPTDVRAVVCVFMGSEHGSSIALERSEHEGEDDSVVVLV